MSNKKPNEEQYFYNVDGQWKTFDEAQSGMGEAYTFDEFKTATTVELSTEQEIQQLESQQTDRMLRQAALGDTESIEMLQAIEDQIAELRLEL